MSCIDAANLTKSYGATRAVDGMDLSVKSGQVFGFLGPNGAGKSTTIKLLTTLVPPSAGSLTVLGLDALSRPLLVRRRIGVVLQQPSYEPTLTVERSLDKYGMMWDVPRPERKRRLEALLKDFDLAGIRRKRNEDLSIGQRRRVQVAREFMHDMELLFLDEPTVGLDPGARRRLLDYLKDRAKAGLTIFYTTHILTEAEYLCDRIAIIDRGRILTVDTPDGLKNRFGKEKTINIRLVEKNPQIASLLSGVAGCKTGSDCGTDVTIHSGQSELVLQQVLRILNDNGVEIEDISATPANLEDIFLGMVKDNAPDN